MKLFCSGCAYAAVLGLLLSVLVGCDEPTMRETTFTRTSQRVLINNFSAPVRTRLLARRDFTASLTVRVSGTISQPVVLAVDQLDTDQKRYLVRRDTLAAGTYADKVFSGDFYGTDAELLVTGGPGTTGSLIIDWSAQ